MRYIVASRVYFIWPKNKTENSPAKSGLSRLAIEADDFDIINEGILRIYKGEYPKRDLVAAFSKGQWEWICKEEDIQVSSETTGLKYE